MFRDRQPAVIPVSDTPPPLPAAGSTPPGGPYGPATPQVRRWLVALSRLTTRDWIILAQEWRARAESAETRAADRALGRAVQGAALEGARDALVGPTVQVAHRAFAAAPAVHEAARLDTEQLAEAALAAGLALLAAPLLAPGDTAALYAHAEPLVPRAALAEPGPPDQG